MASIHSCFFLAEPPLEIDMFDRRMRKMGVEIYFWRKTKKRTLDRFLVVVTFVGQAGVQMQGFPCTPPHCRLLKWSSILNLKQYCHITIFNIATLPYCNLQYCNMQFCNMPYCKSSHSMHTIYSRTASEFHTETNMPYCTILFLGQQIFVESCHPSLHFVKGQTSLGAKPRNKDEHERPAVIKGDHQRRILF